MSSFEGAQVFEGRRGLQRWALGAPWPPHEVRTPGVREYDPQKQKQKWDKLVAFPSVTLRPRHVLMRSVPIDQDLKTSMIP